MLNQVITLLPLLILTSSKCAYRVKDDGKPQKLEEGQNEPYLVQGLTQCLQYNNKMGCCDNNNDISQISSYTQIDGIFGSNAEGCDICAINMKRFWCEYACSPHQADFLSLTKDFYPVPNPQNPEETIMVQKVNLTVHADTACDIYDSCSRIGFVTSVSAMGSPAGFLTFQGHNAVNEAFQYIEVKFSNNYNESLYFSDSEKSPEKKALQQCNETSNKKQIHGFPFLKNCTCNNCEKSCDKNSGFIYTDSAILQDFNWVLVGGVWGAVIVISVSISVYRQKYKQTRDYSKQQ